MSKILRIDEDIFQNVLVACCTKIIYDMKKENYSKEETLSFASKAAKMCAFATSCLFEAPNAVEFGDNEEIKEALRRLRLDFGGVWEVDDNEEADYSEQV